MITNKHEIVLAFTVFVSLVSSAAFALPVLDYTAPTYPNNTIIGENHTEINITVAAQNLDTFKFNWNGANYSIYDTSLVLLMNFNNNSAIGENSTYAVDVSRYGNNGTLYSGAAVCGDAAGCPSFVSGKFGRGLKFDGFNDYVDLGNPSSLRLEGAMTAEAWIYIDSFNNSRIVAKGGGSLNRGWNLNIESGGVGAFQISRTAIEGIAVDTDGNLSKGQWIHLAGVYEPGVALRIYVNGILNNSNTTLIPLSQRDSTLNVNIGRRPDGLVGSDTVYFNGTIDEVRVYNRSLSASEIAIHYQSEFQKYNGAEWRFYNNVTRLANGRHTYYGWANNTAGTSNATETRALLVGCQELATPNTYYVMAQNVSSAGTCFTIKANNITLDGQGYQLNYSKSATGYGINNSLGYDNITIKNLNIVQGNASVSYAHAIYANWMSNSRIENIRVIIEGNYMYTIYFLNSNSNNISESRITTTEDGIYFESSASNTLSNNNITTEDVGIYFNSSASNTISKNNITTAAANNNHGIYLYSGSNSNIISENNIKTNSSGGYGVFIYLSSTNNLINNIVDTFGTSGYGININSSGMNTISGGSIISRNTYEYYLENAGSTNNFRDTNMSIVSRDVYLADTSSYFNYNNEPAGNVWLKTKVSNTLSEIDRIHTLWGTNAIKWNDTNNTAGVTATYNITGLIPNTQYRVSNTSSSGASLNTYTLATNPSGDLAQFTIKLNGNTEIYVSLSAAAPSLPEITTRFLRQGSAWTVTRYTIYDGHIARVTLTYW